MSLCSPFFCRATAVWAYKNSCVVGFIGLVYSLTRVCFEVGPIKLRYVEFL